MMDRINNLLNEYNIIKLKSKKTVKDKKLIEEVETYLKRKEVDGLYKRDVEFNFDSAEDEYKSRLIEDMKNGIFTEDLVSRLFKDEYSRLPRGLRQILECKIEQLKDEEICERLSIKPSSLKTRVYEIIDRYNNKIRTRVDNYYEVQRMKSLKEKATTELIKANRNKNIDKHIKVIHELLDTAFHCGFGFRKKVRKR